MVELATHEWPARRTDAGAAAPVAVLVHGVTGWWRTWWRVGPALAERGWRVVAVDQRGHGRSPRFDGRATVADLTDDLEATIRRLGAPIAALIGHSLGAAVGAELAHRRPTLVARLVLEDPPAITRVDDEAWLANLERELAAAHADFDGEVRRELHENPCWEHEDARQDVEGKRLADRAGLVDSFQADIGVRVLELVPNLRIPTLYLLAAEDRSVFPSEARRRLVANLPAGSHAMVLDGGHTLHRDRFDEYLAAVLDFVG